MLQRECSVQHGGPWPGHHTRAERASRLVRESRRHVEGRRDGTLPRDRHRARRRGRQRRLGRSSPSRHSCDLNCVPTQPANDRCWPLQREPQVKAIMGMAIGALPIIRGVNLAGIPVPTLLVAGLEDDNSPPDNSRFAQVGIPATTDKTLVELPGATHRSFDSTYCAQLQSAGAAFDTNHDGVVSATEAANPGVLADRRIFDRHTVGLIAASAPGFLSGKAVHYCAAQIFTTPVNIEQLVAATPNAEYGCTAAACGVIPPTSGPSTSTCVTIITTVPCTGLDTDQVEQQMSKLAVDFFGVRLERDGDGVPDAADNCPGPPMATRPTPTATAPATPATATPSAVSSSRSTTRPPSTPVAPEGSTRSSSRSATRTGGSLQASPRSARSSPRRSAVDRSPAIPATRSRRPPPAAPACASKTTSSSTTGRPRAWPAATSCS